MTNRRFMNSLASAICRGAAERAQEIRAVPLMPLKCTKRRLTSCVRDSLAGAICRGRQEGSCYVLRSEALPRHTPCQQHQAASSSRLACFRSVCGSGSTIDSPHSN